MDCIYAALFPHTHTPVAEVTMQGATCSLELRNIHTLEPFEAQHAAQTKMLVSVIELHEKKISFKVQKSY